MWNVFFFLKKPFISLFNKQGYIILPYTNALRRAFVLYQNQPSIALILLLSHISGGQKDETNLEIGDD